MTKDVNNELLDLPSSVLDAELGIELAGSERFAWTLLSFLKVSLSDYIAALHEAYDQQDWSTIQMISFHLYESARFCGTPRLTAACLNLHRYLSKGEITLRDALYFQLIKEVDAVRNVL